MRVTHPPWTRSIDFTAGIFVMLTLGVARFGIRDSSSFARFPMTFSCPHLQMEKDFCMKLQTDCVPGRPGCVLRHNSVFAIPAEQRLKEKEQERSDNKGE